MSGDFILPLPYFSHYLNWNVIHARMNLYFEVCQINDVHKQKAILLAALDDKVFSVLRDICHPKAVKDLTYDQLVTLLRQQFVAPISVHRERLKFYASKQELFETVTEWFGRMKSLSVDCRFGARLDAVLLDRFIIGLRSPALLNRLCEETADDERLTLAKAVDIAKHMESAIGVVKLMLEEDEAVAVPYKEG